MNYDEFTGEVQHRLELPGTGQAVRATRAVLTTLGERIEAGEASDLAGPLPMEIGRYLEVAESGQQFDFDEFVDRVADRAELEAGDDGRAEAVYYAQAIIALLDEVAAGNEMDQVRAQFPEDEDFETLFELVGVEEAFEEG